jgi:hypothetical protein
MHQFVPRRSEQQGDGRTPDVMGGLNAAVPGICVTGA